MFEMKVNVEVTSPDMTAAINNLAKAIEKFGSPVVTPVVTKTEVHNEPVNPAPTPAPTPVQTEPVVPVNPTPAPVQATAPVTSPMPASTAAPMPTPTPVPQPVPAPAQPQKAITIDMLAAAGAPLIDQGKMPQLMALLAKYNVQAITQLTPDKYDSFATDLRSIGAQI